jgi:hemerythrin-like domain-containing protein
MKSTEFLIQEHKLILRALDVLDGIAGFIEADGTIDSDDIAKILDFLRWFADAHHQAKEDTILFPALKACGADETRPVQHMMFEHDQERQSIEALEKDVRLGKLSDFAASAVRLSSTMRNHLYKEDHLLFPSADSLLTEEQDKVILDQLNRFDSAFDRQILEQKVHDLNSLEWKYLRK